MDTCTCMAESLHCSPKTITTLLIANISLQNKKLKEKEDADAWIRGGATGLRASSSGLGHGGPGRRRQGDSWGSGLGPQVLSEMETLGGSDKLRGLQTGGAQEAIALVSLALRGGSQAGEDSWESGHRRVMDAVGWSVSGRAGTEWEKNEDWGETGPARQSEESLPPPGGRIKEELAGPG